MDKNDVMFWVVVFMFAITFCGSPDLHDKIIQRIDCQKGEVHGK